MSMRVLKFFLAAAVYITILALHHQLTDDNAAAAHGIATPFSQLSFDAPRAPSFLQTVSTVKSANPYSLRQALKEPELVRADGPVSVWQYRSRKCVLDLYFIEGQADRIAHLEIRPRDPDKDKVGDEKTCLQSIYAQRS